MLRKFKIWIYNNFHFVSGLLLSDLLFYLSLIREWILILFFIIFFFLNLYFLKGAKLAISTFLAPLPFLLAQSFFNISAIYLTLIWLVALILLWNKEKIFWLFYIFFILLISQFILGNAILQPFFVVLFVFLISMTIIYVIFNEKLLSAFIKSFILAESLWLVYFLPVGFIIRAIINFIIFYLILRRNGKGEVVI